MENATIHSDFRKICRENGWKCTPQRLSVYVFVQGNLTHPDVDTVWEAVRDSLPSITRESVYRILNEFAEQGIIRRLDHIDNARYDSRTGLHGHFICRKCGRITDFDWPAGVEIPETARTGTVDHMEFRLIGLCRECSSADAVPRAGSLPERTF